MRKNNNNNGAKTRGEGGTRRKRLEDFILAPKFPSEKVLTDIHSNPLHAICHVLPRSQGPETNYSAFHALEDDCIVEASRCYVPCLA